MKFRKPENVREFDDLVEQSDMRWAVIGMSGVGKTYFQQSFIDDLGWEAFSVDAKIAKAHRREAINLITSYGINNEEDVDRGLLTDQQQNLIRNGFMNVSDPENLDWHSFWYQHSDAKALAQEVTECNVIDRASHHDSNKNLYISTPGSVINHPQVLLQKLKAKALVVHIDLDTPDLIDAAIAQMPGKPIALDKVQRRTKREFESEGNLADFYPWLVRNRRKKYEHLRDVTVKRSKLDGASAQDLVLAVRESIKGNL